MICLFGLAIAFSSMGCAVFGGNNGNWADNVQQIKAEINMFAKLATRIALNEASMPTEDIVIIEGYLIALRDLLSVPGSPDFTGARILVQTMLPNKYRIYGLTIIDILERYLVASNLNITEDQESIISIITAGINGAIEAVKEAE
jgi:hypothetical protein